MNSQDCEEKRRPSAVDEDIDVFGCRFDGDLDAELLFDFLVPEDVEIAKSKDGTDWSRVKTHCSFAPDLCFDF